MKYEKNQPRYFVPYIRIKKSVETHLGTLEVGKEYAVCEDHFSSQAYQALEKDKYHIYVAENYGVNLIGVPIASVELFVKVIEPKFAAGQKVKFKKSGHLPDCVASWSILHGKLWYDNEWSAQTGFANGFYEEAVE